MVVANRNRQISNVRGVESLISLLSMWIIIRLQPGNNGTDVGQSLRTVVRSSLAQSLFMNELVPTEPSTFNN